MNSTDEQFRVDLNDALDASAHDVLPLDPTALVDAGARRVRQRRLAGVAGVAAAAVVVGGGGWAALNLPDQPVAGTPTPSLPRVLGSVDVKVPETPPESPDAVNPASTFRVTVTEDDTIQFAQLSDTGSTVLGQAKAANASTATIGWFPASQDVLILVVPQDAVRVGLLQSGDTGGYSSIDAPVDIPGTTLRAFGFRLADVPRGDNPTFEAIWWRADGSAVTDKEVGVGKQVSLASATVSAWALPQADIIGLDSPDGGTSTVRSDGPDARLTVLEARSTTLNQDKTSTSGQTTLALIKGAVTDVAVTYAEAALTVDAEVIQPWPELDATLVVSRARVIDVPGPEEAPASVVRITWTDAHGVAQEWKP